MLDDTTVKRERIRLWVEALRSRRYPQGQHMLRTPENLKYGQKELKFQVTPEDTFCCLGVGCEVAKDNGLPLTVEVRGGNIYYTYAKHDYSSISFPDAVRDWYGLESDDPIIGFNDKGEPIRALEANDSLNLPFSQIAYLLERTYLGEEDEDGTE